MSKEGNFSGKIAMAKKRIANALTEYAINWNNQQDMLRSGKNWKKLTEDQDMDTTLPPELAAIKNTIDTIPTE